MDEQALHNTVAFIRTGARTLANQEQDNAKAASLLVTGEQLIQQIVKLLKSKDEGKTDEPAKPSVEKMPATMPAEAPLEAE